MQPVWRSSGLSQIYKKTATALPVAAIGLIRLGPISSLSGAVVTIPSQSTNRVMVQDSEGTALDNE